jgi:hypothetical protein
MTLNEAEQQLAKVEEELKKAREDALSATTRANAALKFTRDLAIGLDADIMGTARDIANAIDVQFGKLD